MFMQVYNNSSHAHPAATDLTITDTQATSTRRSLPAPTNQFAYRGGIVPANSQLPALGSVAANGPTQGVLLLFKIQIVSLDNRPLDAEDRRPEERRRDGLGRARRLVARGRDRVMAGLQAGLEHFACDRRGGVAAGAVFDEQHADHDARVERGRERREPGVGVARFARGALQPSWRSLRVLSTASLRLRFALERVHVASSVRRCRSCRRPSRRGSPRRCRCPRARRRSSGGARCARPRRSSPRRPRRGAARARRSAAAGGRRRRSSPRRWPSAARSPAPGPGRSRSSRRRVRPGSGWPAGSVLSAAPGIPARWLKPNRSAVATSRAAPSLTPSGANTELHDTAKASSSVPPHSSPLALLSLTPSSVA